MEPLTTRQQQTLDYIIHYRKQSDYVPAIREIANNFNITPRAAFDRIQTLVNKGFINKTRMQSRALKINACGENSSTHPNVVSIPIVGAIIAGMPILTETNYTGEIDVPHSALLSGEHFALQIRGDSMRDAGILTDDIGIFHHQPHANNGDIVAAMVNEKFTLKRFFRESERIKLQPANDAYNPIYARTVAIFGILIYLVRKYR